MMMQTSKPKIASRGDDGQCGRRTAAGRVAVEGCRRDTARCTQAYTPPRLSSLQTQ